MLDRPEKLYDLLHAMKDALPFDLRVPRALPFASAALDYQKQNCRNVGRVEASLAETRQFLRRGQWLSGLAEALYPTHDQKAVAWQSRSRPKAA